jgi:hypothetical protein
MANPLRGEVAFTVADVEYTLKFSTNAICELEQLQNKGLNEIVGDLERLSTVRALLWAGLRAKHPGVTLVMAGDLIDAIGMVPATEVIGRALNAAFPPPSKDPNA